MPNRSAFTILESLIVLALLAILTWVILALRKHTQDPDPPNTPPGMIISDLR